MASQKTLQSSVMGISSRYTTVQDITNQVVKAAKSCFARKICHERCSGHYKSNVEDVTNQIVKGIYMYTSKDRITCRIVTPNLNGVIILQVESYRVTIVQVVNI